MDATPEVAQVLAPYDVVTAALGRLVAGVRPDQWSAPTPCTEWDTRMLVNHVVGGMLVFVANIDGQAPPDRGRDHLGEDPAAAFATVARELHEAFVRPGVLAAVHPSPLGDAPGSMLVSMRLVEHLVHGWDLGEATGQTLDVPAGLVDRTLADLRTVLPGGRRQGGMFADEQPCAGEAPPLDRLAAFLGRGVGDAPQ
ncbi:MAG TPA: TIGR03086 family metal-binding protein [Candidatus Dormibacteraeota bacterium]|nr:TIGR03086 family metal-binding protein [Candidatus Dormibacteraeota bacterium]